MVYGPGFATRRIHSTSSLEFHVGAHIMGREKCGEAPRYRRDLLERQEFITVGTLNTKKYWHKSR
jgi:hypothetical protein